MKANCRHFIKENSQANLHQCWHYCRPT